MEYRVKTIVVKEGDVVDMPKDAVVLYSQPITANYTTLVEVYYLDPTEEEQTGWVIRDERQQDA